MASMTLTVSFRSRSAPVAIHIFDILHIYRAYTGTFACIDNVPHAHGLDLVADLHTAHTFDTFRRIADDRERMIPWLVLDLDLVWDFNNIQLSGKSLQITIIASYTGGTAKIML